jgi:hypothetical protein
MFLADQQRERDLAWQKKQKKEDRFWEFVILIVGAVFGFFLGRGQPDGPANAQFGQQEKAFLAEKRMPHADE